MYEISFGNERKYVWKGMKGKTLIFINWADCVLNKYMTISLMINVNFSSSFYVVLRLLRTPEVC